ncbi:MAG: phage holin family protein [Deltaproteobacteria bacterium]|nr:phage holin family protein [Deltaproteobacteria bacterium]MBW2401910.1 phage holin family protein [Deltaproteobacteria bacterium]
MSATGNDLSDLSIAARRVSASLVEGIHLRLDLFSLEFGEERRRVSMILLTTLALALAGFMVLLCVNAALLIVFWDEWRVEVALGLCGFYSAAALGLAFANARRIRRGVRAFEATREVLESDRRSLREPS